MTVLTGYISGHETPEKVAIIRAPVMREQSLLSLLAQTGTEGGCVGAKET
jgi:hypothetical protein